MRVSDGHVAWKQRLEVSFFKPKYMSVSDQSCGVEAKFPHGWHASES